LVEDGQERLVVAELGKPHGIRGEITGRLFGVTPEELLGIEELTLRDPEGRERSVRIEGIRPRKLGCVLALDAVADRNAAEVHRGSEWLARRADLPPPEEGEWLVADLVGLEVETDTGENLGRLEEVFLLPANDVVVVRGPRGEVLLPVLPDVILRVDTEAGRMVVRVPPGLIED